MTAPHTPPTSSPVATPTAPVTLRYALPITLDPLLRTIAAHAVPGVEECDVDGRRHRRVVRGPDVVLTVEWGQPGELTVSAMGATGPAPVDAALVALVRRWLDLDCDVAAVSAHLGASGLLAPFVAARPGLRVLGSTDGFETAVMTVLGQQVSLAAARTFGGRLVAGLGRPAPAGMRAFPTPDAVAETEPEDLRAMVGLTRARAATVVGLAQAVVDGRVWLDGAAHDDLDGLDPPARPAASPSEARAALLSLTGIGPWTADYLALRLFGDRDAYPADDLVLKRALGVTSGRAAAALSADWAPLRAYAVTHLWTQAVYG
ncbi:DNA-3-methyladenine glycosylase family protein [Sanguibacter suarezii]|uniref:DNA-3-methyladenine glycosylase family protein n=1 Tax=Sanguibacter suarezii TaxID=60921 RepID=UPI000830D8A8|nr:AlkA N-terminal domain-containing protein [Sanguibacter suarezii]